MVSQGQAAALDSGTTATALDRALGSVQNSVRCLVCWFIADSIPSALTTLDLAIGVASPSGFAFWSRQIHLTFI